MRFWEVIVWATATLALVCGLSFWPVLRSVNPELAATTAWIDGGDDPWGNAYLTINNSWEGGGVLSPGPDGKFSFAAPPGVLPEDDVWVHTGDAEQGTCPDDRLTTAVALAREALLASALLLPWCAFAPRLLRAERAGAGWEVVRAMLLASVPSLLAVSVSWRLAERWELQTRNPVLLVPAPVAAALSAIAACLLLSLHLRFRRSLPTEEAQRD